MLNRIFNSETKSISGAAFLLAGSMLGSRILALFRDRLLAGRFGAGEELDIYFTSFRIPDLVYAILITGGISAAFLPVFSEYFRKNKEEAWQLVSNILNVFLVLLILTAGILAIFAPFLVEVIAPGFNVGQKAATVLLARIIFLGSIVFGVSGILSGILHYFNRFFAYSLAPILYNLGIIVGILFFVPAFGLVGLAYGVVFGSLLHFFIQLPAAFMAGYKWKPIFNLKNWGLQKMFRLMLPRTIGQASYHINLVVITAIGSTLAAGSIAVFNLSYNLQYFPIGLIGISFAIAAFPNLSRLWAAGEKQKFLSEFSLSFRQVLFLVIPASILMFLLRAQIVRLILGTGQFGWLDTRLTAASLGLLAFGIFSASLIPLLARGFFSLQDTKTPVVVGVLAVVLNIILALFFVWLLGSESSFKNALSNFLKLEGIENIKVVALSLALSISSIFHFFLLLFLFNIKVGGIGINSIWWSLRKILAGSIFAGLSTYFILYLLAGFLNMQTFTGVFLQAFVAFSFGVVVYGVVVYLLKSPEIKPQEDEIHR